MKQNISASRAFILLGTLSVMLGVIMDAFGAHALRDTLDTEALSWYRTGVQYQMFHGLGLFGTGLLAAQVKPSPAIKLAGWLMAAGTVLFCGSLYLIAITGNRSLGGMAPLGGSVLVAAWLALAWGSRGARK